MVIANIGQEKELLQKLAGKSYAELFNIRSRIERREWERMSIKNLRERIFHLENKNPSNKNVLYLHIPFCATRCDYCPYFTKLYDRHLVNEYIDALITEINLIKNSAFIQSTKFECVYFGGGTPSILTIDQIERLAKAVFSGFSFTKNPEITFEANPATLTGEKIATLKGCGFNRVSLGIQSFQERILRSLNCAHTTENAIKVINNLLDQGLVVNIDMIFGLIGQSKTEWEDDIRRLCQIKPAHQITLFPLRLAEDTPLRQNLEQKTTLDVAAHRMDLLEYDTLAERILTSHGYVREESSVFYYKKGSYPHKYHSTETRVVGLGASAGTLLDEGECSNYDVDEYIEDLKLGSHTSLSGLHLTERQAHERFIVFRILYMNRSLPNFKDIVAKRFREFYGVDMKGLYDTVIEDMMAKRFITMQNGRIQLTDRLWRILERVKIGMPSIL